MFCTRIEFLICAKCPSNAQLLMNSCLSSIDEVFTDFIILNLHNYFVESIFISLDCNMIYSYQTATNVKYDVFNIHF